MSRFAGKEFLADQRALALCELFSSHSRIRRFAEIKGRQLRPMRRSSDPLTAATTSILNPWLSPHGFRTITRRSFGSVRNDILHFFDLQLSAYGGKDFTVNYASIPLFQPHDFIVLDCGDRLRSGAAEAWWPSSTHQLADNSMHEVVAGLQAQALPFFASTSTVSGLLDVLAKSQRASRHHLEFECACALARLGRVSEASQHLREAVSLYEADGRSWCAGYIAHCNRLLHSIRQDSVEALLREWIDYSIEHLAIAPLLHAANDA